MDKVGKLLNFVNFDKLSQNYENLLNIMKFRQYCEIFFLSKLWNSVKEILNFVEIMMSEHCVRHCTLMMVCGIVLGKAKTTKVGMVWYELNIVNQRMTEWISMVGIELVGQLKVWIRISRIQYGGVTLIIGNLGLGGGIWLTEQNWNQTRANCYRKVREQFWS